MRIQNLKSVALVLVLLGFYPDFSYSEQAISAEPVLMMDKACVANGMDNLKRRFPSLSEGDVKKITTYGCFCAYKEAQRTRLPSVGLDLWNATDCISYAVLRNAMRSTNNAALIESRCLASFPRDLTDDSANEDAASFCKCASVPVSTINSGGKKLKLTEDQLYETIVPISKACR
ncbi:hypothetical protein [uncultured Legionella sp.]|uniref:hypothetical protein n=1 Tax=uncultured Legionella sp. TaxID=210934 RepID=UPI0026379681|nr:hypothetical protein [uncultured Legionella sp.]